MQRAAVWNIILSFSFNHVHMHRQCRLLSRRVNHITSTASYTSHFPASASSKEHTTLHNLPLLQGASPHVSICLSPATSKVSPQSLAPSSARPPLRPPFASACPWAPGPRGWGGDGGRRIGRFGEVDKPLFEPCDADGRGGLGAIEVCS